MDTDREQRELAIRESDRLALEFEMHERRRAQQQKQSAPMEIVRKTYQPRPAQQQQTAAMDPETQRGWDKWVKSHIDMAIHVYHEQSSEQLEEAIAEFVVTYVREKTTALRKEFETELASLRADMNIQTGIARGEISELKSSVPTKRRSDVA